MKDTSGASATSAACSFSTRATAVSRSASTSCRTTRVTRPSARSPRSAPYTSGTRNPPPPRIVSLTPSPPFLSRPRARPLLPTRTVSPGPADRSSPPCPAPRVRRPAPCPYPRTSRGRRQDDPVTGLDHGALDRYLDHGGVHDLSARASPAGAEEGPVDVRTILVVFTHFDVQPCPAPTELSRCAHDPDRRLRHTPVITNTRTSWTTATARSATTGRPSTPPRGFRAVSSGGPGTTAFFDA